MNTVHRHADATGIKTGSPRDIPRMVKGMVAEQVLVIPLGNATPERASEIAMTVGQVVQLVGLNLQRQDSFEDLVLALLPKRPPEPTQLRALAMQAKARKAILESGDWMTAKQIAEVAQFSASNPSAQPSKWKREKRIFSLLHHGTDYYPSYGMDPATARPLKALGDVIRAFGSAKDDWGLAYWFSSANSFLGGKRPQDLLANDPQAVIAAIEDELEPVAHG
jgi:hypothetical protein